MKTYLVRFFRKAEREGDKDTFLGSVEVDEAGVDQRLSIMAKAFRQAPPRCLYADLVKVERV